MNIAAAGALRAEDITVEAVRGHPRRSLPKVPLAIFTVFACASIRCRDDADMFSTDGGKPYVSHFLLRAYHE